MSMMLTPKTHKICRRVLFRYPGNAGSSGQALAAVRQHIFVSPHCIHVPSSHHQAQKPFGRLAYLGAQNLPSRIRQSLSKPGPPAAQMPSAHTARLRYCESVMGCRSWGGGGGGGGGPPPPQTHPPEIRMPNPSASWV